MQFTPPETSPHAALAILAGAVPVADSHVVALNHFRLVNYGDDSQFDAARQEVMHIDLNACCDSRAGGATLLNPSLESWADIL